MKKCLIIVVFIMTLLSNGLTVNNIAAEEGEVEETLETQQQDETVEDQSNDGEEIFNEDDETSDKSDEVVLSEAFDDENDSAEEVINDITEQVEEIEEDEKNDLVLNAENNKTIILEGEGFVVYDDYSMVINGNMDHNRNIGDMIASGEIVGIFDETQGLENGTRLPSDYFWYGEQPWNDIKDKIVSIELKDVTEIPDYAFFGCTSLKTITIPNTVTYIGYGAFMGCTSLVSIYIPESVDYIEAQGEEENVLQRYGSFVFCPSLTSIIVDENNPVYDSRDNCNAIIETSTNALILGCKNTLIPDSVTAIEHGAFMGSSVTTIDIPNSVTRIGQVAFAFCLSLSSIDLPNSITLLDRNLFQNCTKLTDVIIPDSVTEIIYAFKNCTSLRSINIPGSLTRGIGSGPRLDFGDSAFFGCSSLSSITVDENNPFYDSRDNCNAIIETSTNTLLFGCNNTTIPESIERIGDSALYGCSGLTSIVIPNSVTEIGPSAFEGCSSLVSVAIPDSLTSIGDGAFANCSSLKSIELSNSLTCINDYVFKNCESLESVDIPDSITSIVDSAFENCISLKSIYIPQSVTTIYCPANGGSWSDHHRGIASCTSLETIIVDKNNPVYDSRDNCNAIISTQSNELIIGCGKTIIPNSVTSIGSSAFNGCNSLTSIKIPDSIEYIYDYAFANCVNLESITIPELSNIEYNVFYNCLSLKQISIPVSTYLYLCGYGIAEESKIESIHFTKSKRSYNYNVSYKETIGYLHRDSLKEIVFEEGITTISNNILYDLDNVETLVLPDSLEYIELGGFNELTGLKNITLPISLDVSGLFADNLKLESVTFTSGDGSVVNYTDSNYNLTPWYQSDSDNLEINIEDGITSIGNYTFKDLSGIESITIPDSVTRIGNEAFSGCSNLESLTMPFSASIGSTSFDDVSNLRNVHLTAGNGIGTNYNTVSYQYTPWHKSYLNNMKVTLDEGITSIGPYTFYNCTGITSINVPNSVDYIGYYAFYGLQGLSDIYVPESVDEIGQYAFGSIENVYTGAKAKKENWNNLWHGSSNVHYDVSEEEYYDMHVESFNIIFNGNGSTSGSMEPMLDLKCNRSHELTANSYVKKGYVFTSWNISEDGSGLSFEDGQSIADLSEYVTDIILYAQWRPVTYTIRYHSGSDIYEETHEYDKEYELAGDVFHAEGGVLAGWNTNEDLSGTTYRPNQSVMNLCEEDNAVFDLYAIYSSSTLEPYADPEPGVVDKDTRVSLYSDTPGASVYYTLDGSDPDTSSILFSDPIIIREYTIIKAIAVSDELPDSKVVTFTYIVNDGADYGTIDPEDIATYEELNRPTGFWTSKMVYDPEDPEIKPHYTGDKITLSFRVYHGNSLLNIDKDYSIKYSNNIKASSHDDAKAPTVTITGKGNYVGTLDKKFDILPVSLNEDNAAILLNKDTFISNSKAQKPNVTVEYRGIKLKNNTDYIVVYEDANSSAEGSYSITVTGQGNYTGSLDKQYRILPSGTALKPVSSLSYSKVSNQTYTSNEIIPGITVKDGKTILVEGEDYTATYVSNVNAGTAYILIEGIESNGYTGTMMRSFKINPVKLTAKNCTVLGLDDSYEFDPSGAISPDTSLEYEGSGLTLNKDYTVVLKNNNKAGTATITYKGINNYSGSFNKTFKIDKVTIEEYMFDFDPAYPYCKGGVKAVPVSDLVLNRDYTLSYKNNSKLGTATVTVKGKGNYAGTLTHDYDIETKDIGAVSISVPDKVYSTKTNGWKSNPVLTDEGGKKLSAGTDYDKEIVYTYRFDTVVLDGSSKEKVKPEITRSKGDMVVSTDIIPAGTFIDVTVTTDNAKTDNYEGTTSAYYRIVSYDIAKAKVTIPVQYYTGREITLNKSDITVQMNKQNLRISDYDIISYINNVNKGTAKVTIKGKGQYGGTKTVNFTIRQLSFGNIIHYDLNGGTGTLNDQLIYKDTALANYNDKKTVNGITYTFKGWSTVLNGDIVYRNKQLFTYDPKMAGRTIVLYAVWGQ